MIICLARICISSDKIVLIHTIVSVKKLYIVPSYNDPLSSSCQTIFLSSLSHHAAPVFLTACLAACACFSIVSRLCTYLLRSCFARVRLLSCACFKRYFSIIRRNCMFVVCSLHDWFHDSQSSPSAPAMMFFIKTKHWRLR